MTEALSLERVNWRTVGSACLIEGYLPLEQLKADQPPQSP